MPFFFPECLFLSEKMLLRCKIKNKGVFTVVPKRRFYGSGIVAAVFALEHNNSGGYFWMNERGKEIGCLCLFGGKKMKLSKKRLI